jgi:hypothetical protein
VESILDILKDPEASGMALVVAVDKLFKGQCFAWEFDTLFEELEEEYNITLLPEAADRLMALLAIKLNPAHLWDASVFANLVETLNYHECLTDTYEECSPGEVCWALKELEMFGTHYNLPFNSEMYNDDPRIFIACCIATAGWIVLPEELEFCREEYRRTSRLDKHASPEQEAKVLSLVAKKEFEVSDDEDVVQVQVSKIRECEHYIQHRINSLNKYLETLSRAVP